MLTKSQIRQIIKADKKLLTEDQKSLFSEQALSLLETMTEFVHAEKCGIYHSLSDEVNTHKFIEKWTAHKDIYLPRIIGDNLEMVKYIKPDNMIQGEYNIMEPTDSESVNLSELDLIVVPAVALSYTGQRIGRGKGYYDRLLKDSSILKIGLVFDMQLCETFDSDNFDIPVDIIVTNKKIIYLNK